MSNGYETVKSVHKIFDGPSYLDVMGLKFRKLFLEEFKKLLLVSNKSTILMDKNMLELQRCEYIAVPL